MKRNPAFTLRAVPRAPFAIVAAVVAAACAAPILATQTESGAVSAAALSCGVSAVERGGAVTFRPWLRSETGAFGDYSLTLSRTGTLVEQGGAFVADAGVRTELASATLPGPARAYDLRMGVTVGGTHYNCRGDAAEI